MTLLEIIVIICCLFIVFGNIGYYLYKKLKKLPVGQCSECSKRNILKEYKKWAANEKNR